MSTLTVWAPPLPPYFLSRWSSVSASSWQNSQHSPLNVSATAPQDKQEEVQRHVNSNSWEEIILQNQVLILSTMYLYQEGWGEVEIIITGRFISGEFTGYLWISAKEIVNEEMLNLQLYEISVIHILAHLKLLDHSLSSLQKNVQKVLPRIAVDEIWTCTWGLLPHPVGTILQRSTWWQK